MKYCKEKNITFLLISLMMSFHVLGQGSGEELKIGEYVKILKNDSILIYCNCTGVIVDKSCAAFYRVGKMDSVNLGVGGKFSDYYMNGKLLLEAFMKNGFLESEAKYYYENGQLRSRGLYKSNKKTGVWVYFYKNGNRKKIVNYINDYPFISEYYKKNGKQMVSFGNGKYIGEYYAYKSCNPFLIKGEMKDGKMHGKWIFYNANPKFIIGNEFFDNGKFIKGVSGTDKYSDFPRIKIDGYCPNENVCWVDNHFGCPGESVYKLTYKNENLNMYFYPELLEELRGKLGVKNKIENQWLIVGLNISKEAKLRNVCVKSSINENYCEDIVRKSLWQMDNFTPAKINHQVVNFDLFFTILINDNQIIIPKVYLYK